MPLSKHSTLTQFLIEERRRFPGASGDFNALLLDVAALALRLNKPLTARLMPIPGKKAGRNTNKSGN